MSWNVTCPGVLGAGGRGAKSGGAAEEEEAEEEEEEEEDSEEEAEDDGGGEEDSGAAVESDEEDTAGSGLEEADAARGVAVRSAERETCPLSAAAPLPVPESAGWREREAAPLEADAWACTAVGAAPAAACAVAAHCGQRVIPAQAMSRDNLWLHRRQRSKTNVHPPAMADGTDGSSVCASPPLVRGTGPGIAAFRPRLRHLSDLGGLCRSRTPTRARRPFPTTGGLQIRHIQGSRGGGTGRLSDRTGTPGDAVGIAVCRAP